MLPRGSKAMILSGVESKYQRIKAPHGREWTRPVFHFHPPIVVIVLVCGCSQSTVTSSTGMADYICGMFRDPHGATWGRVYGLMQRWETSQYWIIRFSSL